MNDPFNLARFVDAQRPVFNRVMDELRAGRKTSHWIWFVFPQLKGLGRSEMATRFGIAHGAEARAYTEHPVLGPRLVACVQTLLEHSDSSVLHILGSPDDLKLRSCLTLFNDVQPHVDVYQRALDQFYGGKPDDRTLELLHGLDE